MVERKIFLQIQSLNVIYPNEENKILVPVTKRMETIMSIQVCLLCQMNFDNMENGAKKAFLANPKHKYHISQCGEHDCHANNKNKGDYYEYLSLSLLTDKL